MPVSRKNKSIKKSSKLLKRSNKKIYNEYKKLEGGSINQITFPVHVTIDKELTFINGMIKYLIDVNPNIVNEKNTITIPKNTILIINKNKNLSENLSEQYYIEIDKKNLKKFIKNFKIKTNQINGFINFYFSENDLTTILNNLTNTSFIEVLKNKDIIRNAESKARMNNIARLQARHQARLANMQRQKTILNQKRTEALTLPKTLDNTLVEISEKLVSPFNEFEKLEFPLQITVKNNLQINLTKENFKNELYFTIDYGDDDEFKSIYDSFIIPKNTNLEISLSIYKDKNKFVINFFKNDVMKTMFDKQLKELNKYGTVDDIEFYFDKNYLQNILNNSTITLPKTLDNTLVEISEKLVSPFNEFEKLEFPLQITVKNNLNINLNNVNVKNKVEFTIDYFYDDEYKSIYDSFIIPKNTKLKIEKSIYNNDQFVINFIKNDIMNDIMKTMFAKKFEELKHGEKIDAIEFYFDKNYLQNILHNSTMI